MIWVDAHISPALAKWIAAEIGEPAQSVRDLGLSHAKDKDIFAAAGTAEETGFYAKVRIKGYGFPQGCEYRVEKKDGRWNWSPELVPFPKLSS